MKPFRARSRSDRAKDYSAIIEQLLEPYEVWQAGKHRWRAACCVHKGDNTTAFTINRWGKWHCFRCGARGQFVDLLVLGFSMPRAQAEKYAGDVPAPLMKFEDVPLLPSWENRPKNKVEYPILKEALLAPYVDGCPRYLLNRGFSVRSLRAYEIGYDLQKSRIVIPARDVRENLVGLTYRADFEEGLMFNGVPVKYWHDQWQKDAHLWGLHKWKSYTKQFWLVEGQLDVVRLYQLGIPAAAIMGSYLSEEQKRLIIDYVQTDKLVLGFDNDEAGYKVTRQAIKELSCTRHGKRLFWAKYDANDPGELGPAHKIEYAHWADAILYFDMGIDYTVNATHSMRAN